MKSISRTECGNPIRFKDDLRVAGKLMQPYHSQCLDRPNTLAGRLNRFSGAFPQGFRFWLWLIIGNFTLVWIINQNPDAAIPLSLFLLVCNAVFVGGRIAIYFWYEKHLK